MARSTFSVLCRLLILAVIASESAVQSSYDCQDSCAANESCEIIGSTSTCICVPKYERENSDEPCLQRCRMNINCDKLEYCTGKVCKPLSSDPETAKEQRGMAVTYWELVKPM